jgi:hypothetical protein
MAKKRGIAAETRAKAIAGTPSIAPPKAHNEAALSSIASPIHSSVDVATQVALGATLWQLAKNVTGTLRGYVARNFGMDATPEEKDKAMRSAEEAFKRISADRISETIRAAYDTTVDTLNSLYNANTKIMNNNLLSVGITREQYDQLREWSRALRTLKDKAFEASLTKAELQGNSEEIKKAPKLKSAYLESFLEKVDGIASNVRDISSAFMALDKKMKEASIRVLGDRDPGMRRIISRAPQSKLLAGLHEVKETHRVEAQNRSALASPKAGHRR